jgi:hypothetical protein
MEKSGASFQFGQNGGVGNQDDHQDSRQTTANRNRGSEEGASTYITGCQTSENPLPISREMAQTTLNVCAPNVEKERAMTNEL